MSRGGFPARLVPSRSLLSVSDELLITIRVDENMGAFSDPNGYNDRRAILIIRQILDGDSKEAMAAERGGSGQLIGLRVR